MGATNIRTLKNPNPMVKNAKLIWTNLKRNMCKHSVLKPQLNTAKLAIQLNCNSTTNRLRRCCLYVHDDSYVITTDVNMMIVTSLLQM